MADEGSALLNLEPGKPNWALTEAKKKQETISHILAIFLFN